MQVDSADMNLDAVVLDIVQEVLRRPTVAPDDDLFDLGFDSLMIAMTAARIQRRLGVEIPLAVYFDAETVAHLVDDITEHLLDGAGGQETDGDD
jgi:acyl carrier protein